MTCPINPFDGCRSLRDSLGRKAAMYLDGGPTLLSDSVTLAETDHISIRQNPQEAYYKAFQAFKETFDKALRIYSSAWEHKLRHCPISQIDLTLRRLKAQYEADMSAMECHSSRMTAAEVCLAKHYYAGPFVDRRRIGKRFLLSAKQAHCEAHRDLSKANVAAWRARHEAEKFEVDRYQSQSQEQRLQTMHDFEKAYRAALNRYQERIDVASKHLLADSRCKCAKEGEGDLSNLKELEEPLETKDDQSSDHQEPARENSSAFEEQRQKLQDLEENLATLRHQNAQTQQELDKSLQAHKEDQLKIKELEGQFGIAKQQRSEWRQGMLQKNIW